MTTTQLKEALNLACLTVDSGKEVLGGYCGDLLSHVMGKAASGCAWVTVMGNVNAVAVASLVDAACIILADGATLDNQAREKAVENEVCVFSSGKDAYSLCVAINEVMK